MVPIETTCESCGETCWQGDIRLYPGNLCDPCQEDLTDQQTTVWLSNGEYLLGPIGCRKVKKHPNLSMTFQVTDPEWLINLGWGPSAYVEIQAYYLTPGVKIPRDTYWWNDGFGVRSGTDT